MTESLPLSYAEQKSSLVTAAGGVLSVKLDPVSAGYELLYPPTTAAGALTNNGTGTLTWSSGGGGVTSAVNVGIGGVGVFRDRVGTDLRFKKINGTSKLSVVDDVPDSEVQVDVVESALVLSNMGGVLDTIRGGTGVASPAAGRFLVGAGASPVTTAKVVPAGAVVGTSDTQTITGKTWGDELKMGGNGITGVGGAGVVAAADNVSDLGSGSSRFRNLYVNAINPPGSSFPLSVGNSAGISVLGVADMKTNPTINCPSAAFAWMDAKQDSIIDQYNVRRVTLVGSGEWEIAFTSPAPNATYAVSVIAEYDGNSWVSNYHTKTTDGFIAHFEKNGGGPSEPTFWSIIVFSSYA